MDREKKVNSKEFLLPFTLEPAKFEISQTEAKKKMLLRPY